MTEEEDSAESKERKKLAVAVAIELKPMIRREMWQVGIVCSLVIWTIGYFFVIAVLLDRPTNQINTLNVEQPHSQEDLQREILKQQGHIKGDSR